MTSIPWKTKMITNHNGNELFINDTVFEHRQLDSGATPLLICVQTRHLYQCITHTVTIVRSIGCAHGKRNRSARWLI